MMTSLPLLEAGISGAIVPSESAQWSAAHCAGELRCAPCVASTTQPVRDLQSLVEANLGPLATTFGALLGATITLVALFVQGRQYIAVRRSEAASRESEARWRRFEAMTKQWDQLLTDVHVKNAIRAIDVDAPELRVLLTTPAHLLSSGEYAERAVVDRYLETLERLVYAVELDTLTYQDVDYLGWHFRRIVELTHLESYCRSNSYRTVADYARAYVTRHPDEVRPPGSGSMKTGAADAKST